MYVNPKSHAGKISNDKLKLHLDNFLYDPVPITTGIWRHQTCPIKFSLVVNDFEIKYERQEDITNLLDSLKTIYKISEDWDGKLYRGFNL